MSPAISPATNPAALRMALETQGESLTRGLPNLLRRRAEGPHQQTDEAGPSNSGATSR